MADTPIRTGPPTARLLVLVTPDFNLAATMAFLDPFRAANYLGATTLFDWTLASTGGGPTRASNGCSLETQPLKQAETGDYEIVLVSSSWTPEKHAAPPLMSCLRRQYQRGATLAALDTGGFLLARGGFLDGKRATVHYEHIDAFAELFPAIDVSEDLFVFADRAFTCCGGTASADFALQIIRRLHDDETANAAARYIFQAGIRPPGTRQNAELGEPIGATIPGILRRAIDLMEANLEHTLPIAALCTRLGISHRQLSRLFSAYVHKPPSAYYRDIRLDRARGLITQTEMPIAEIALAAGFQSHVHFSRAYRQRFGLPPIRDRVEGRVAFAYRAWPMFARGAGD